MFLSDLSIRRPVFTAMMSLSLIVVGLLAYLRLPVDQFPPVDFPVMLVQTIYPGASPEDIERDVTKPLEDSVASIAGLDELQSFSRDNVSLLILQFKMGVDLSDAVSSVRDRVGVVKGELPNGAEEPIIRQIEFGALPVMVVALSSPGGMNATRDLADERLRPFLEQVPGVGSVNVLGGQDREIQIDLNLDVLASLGVAPAQIAERLGIENLSLPAGQFDQQGFTVSVRANGQFKSIEDLKQAIVYQTREGRTVTLQEVAILTDGHARPTRFVSFNGQSAVSLEIIKRSGSNTVEIAKGVKAALEEVVPTLGPNVKYDIIADQSADIEANAHEVWIAIFFGGFMAVLVILFFLLDFRGTLISALALPTSVIGTFAAMGALGFSINTMTLLGLSLAIGLLIDDAVVVREAITRRLEAGDSPKEAASRGTKEIALAVMATTLSLVAVFVPVAFMSGIIGQFFKQFGLTIAVSVMLSLFVAFTLDPMLSSRFSKAVGHHPPKSLFGRIERILNWIDSRYTSVLEVSIRHGWKTLGITSLTFLASFALLPFIPMEFVPQEDRGEVLMDFRLPIGTSLEATREAAEETEAKLLQIPGVKRVYTVVGIEEQANRARFRLRIIPKTERKEPLSYFKDKARAIAGQTPGSEVTISDPGAIEGLGDWPPLMIILQSENGEALAQEAERIKTMLENVPGATDVRLSVPPGKPELRIEIDRTLAADRGIPSGLIATSTRMMVEGQIVGTLKDGGPEADIRVRAANTFAASTESIANLPLWTPVGRVSVGDVAKVSMSSGPSEIQRYNRLKSITVSVQLAPDGNLGQIVESFQSEIQKQPLVDGVLFTISGQARDMVDTANAMGLAVFIALTFIFMVLASQFESLIHPFTLLASVPLAMVGALIALFVTRHSLSMGSQIGFILLMGLVTKNAILLVDGALQQMREGFSPTDAMLHAGPRRLRPILMTSAAMVFGMIPTAIGTGIGAEFRAPMAIAVIGGVLSSTLLTLLVIPTIFLKVENMRVRIASWLGSSSD